MPGKLEQVYILHRIKWAEPPKNKAPSYFLATVHERSQKRAMKTAIFQLERVADGKVGTCAIHLCGPLYHWKQEVDDGDA